MKHYLLSLVLFLLLTTQTRAQTSVYHPFPDSDAVWNVNRAGGLITCVGKLLNENFSYIISGDTVINSVTYHKLFIPFVQKTDTCSIWHTLPGYAGGIRQNVAAKQVFLIAPGDTQEYVLYDFSLQPGDVATFPPSLNCSSTDTVESIDSVLIGSDYRKRWNLQSFSLTDNAIIEGIGFTSGPIAPCTFPDGAGWQLTCFEQNGTVLYHPNAASPCDVIASVNELSEAGYVVSVSPNPVADQLTVHSSTFYPVGWTSNGVNDEAPTVSIKNIVGQEASPPAPLQRRGEEAAIDVSGLSAGIYFLEIKSDKDIVVKRFVKE